MSNNNAERIQKLDILEKTWLGVTNRLQELFSKKSGITNKNIQVIPSADPEDVEYLQQQKEGTLELPIIGISPVQVEPDINSYNTAIMRREGHAVQIELDRSNWIVLKLSPVLVTFQVVFVTDDVLTMMRMLDRWTSTELWSFQIGYKEYGIKIQLQADKTIQVPARVLTNGNTRQFRLSTTLRAKSYSGYMWYIPAIRYVQLKTMIPIKGTILDALEDPDTLAETVRNQTIVANPVHSKTDFEPKI